MSSDIIDRLRIDPGKRTIGELMQDRERALHEIIKLQSDLDRLRTARAGTTPRPELAADVAEKRAFRPGTLIKISQICELAGTSRATIYRWVSKGTFPAPVRINEHTVRWKIDDIDTWRETL